MTHPIVIASLLGSLVHVAGIVLLMGGILLLGNGFIRQKKHQQAIGDFEERLKKPNFEVLEKHFGHIFPADLKAIYNNSNELSRGNFMVVGQLSNGGEAVWDIAYYEPADSQGVIEGWSEKQEAFEFANDGCGNTYAIDPRQDDSPVMFHDHETGKWKKVADTFSQFMSMPRRPKKISS